MANKMLINFKKETYDKFMITYVGAREIQPMITKTSLISSVIESSLVDLECTFTDKKGQYYSFSDLYKKGVEVVYNIFEDIIRIKDDYTFIKRIEGFDSFKEEIEWKSVLADIINEFFKNKITESDIEALLEIIYSYEIGSCYKEKNKGVFDSYIVFDYINQIIKRYKDINNKFEYYSILTDFILREFKKLKFDKIYEISFVENFIEKNFENYKFYNEFFDKLEKEYSKDINIDAQKVIFIKGQFTEEELNFLKSRSIILINNRDDIEYVNFDIEYYLYLLIEKDLKKLLKNILNIDFKEYINNNFETFNYIFYKKRIVEVMNIRKKDDGFNYKINILLKLKEGN